MSISPNQKYVINKKSYGKVDPPKQKKSRIVDYTTYLSLNSKTANRKNSYIEPQTCVEIVPEISQEEIERKIQVTKDFAATIIQDNIRDFFQGVDESGETSIPVVQSNDLVDIEAHSTPKRFDAKPTYSMTSKSSN